MFSSEQASVVLLTKLEDIIKKMAYAHANPCAADLVEYASQWPGVSSVAAIVKGRSLGTWGTRRFVAIAPDVGVGALDPAPS